MTKDIVQETRITGLPSSITIKTLNGNLTNQSSAAEEFKVKAAAGSEHSKWVIVPKTFSHDELPVEIK